jgi:hypothetical protein
LRIIQYMRTASLLAWRPWRFFFPSLTVKWTCCLRHSGTLRTNIARVAMFVDLTVGQPENVARIVRLDLAHGCEEFSAIAFSGCAAWWIVPGEGVVMAPPT